MKAKVNYLIIGSGKVSKHFKNYFRLLGLPTLNWSRKHNRIEELAEYNSLCSHVLLLISDASIESFVSENSLLLEKKCIHFSGTLISNVVFGAHPLMTFGNELYDLGTYKKVPFILEDKGPPLGDLLPGVPNKEYRIPQNSKAFYHMLIVMGNNFTTMLWQHVISNLENKLCLPRETVYPIMEQTLTNLINDPFGSLTGPFERNDRCTISSHLKLLDSSCYKDIYEAFMKVFFSKRNLQ